MMASDQAVAGLFCGLIVGLLIVMIIGATFLRAAITIYNAMLGEATSPKSVPEPDYGSAIGIIFATSVAQGIASILIRVVTGAGLVATGPDATGRLVVAQLISIAVGLVIMSLLLSRMLPTTFARAVLVTLCYVLVWVLVCGLLAVITFRIMGELGMHGA